MTPHAPAKVTGEFAIGVRYLTGYAVQSDGRGRQEWPPHPARLFMALVAACCETEGEAAQFEALRWMEALDPPRVVACEEWDRRESVTVYVPPNDVATPKNAEQVPDNKVFANMRALPQYRTNRQPRTFPRLRPHHDTVHFLWDAPLVHRKALAAICRHVNRLGHASSLVQAWLETEPNLALEGRVVYEPQDIGRVRLRTTNPGTFEELVARYRQKDIEDHFRLEATVLAGKGKAKQQAKQAYLERFGRAWRRGSAPERMRPAIQTTATYGTVQPETEVPGTLFDPAPLMLRLTPRESRYPRLAASTSVKVCHELRRAIMAQAEDGFECITGHRPDGAPTTRPHLALFPLPHVGSHHADGHLLGAAVALPAKNELSPTERRAVIAAVQALENEPLKLGKLGTWDVALAPFDDGRKMLMPDGWTAAPHGARCWATVTPVAFDRHPKARNTARRDEQLAAMIRRACERIDLCEPVRVTGVSTSPVSAHLGAPPARDYPALQRKDGSKRQQLHVTLWFDRPVCGPVLLGAGRFRGHGLCRPHHERSKG